MWHRQDYTSRLMLNHEQKRLPISQQLTKDASNFTSATHFAEGDTLKDEPFENLVAGISDRVEAVIRAQGGYTKY